MIIQNNDTMVVVKRFFFKRTNERTKSAVTRFRGRDFAFASHLSRFFTPPSPPPGLMHLLRSCSCCCCFSFWSFSCTPFRLNFVSSSTRDAGVPLSGRFLRPRSSTTLRCLRGGVSSSSSSVVGFGSIGSVTTTALFSGAVQPAPREEPVEHDDDDDSCCSFCALFFCPIQKDFIYCTGVFGY